LLKQYLCEYSFKPLLQKKETNKIIAGGIAAINAALKNLSEVP
jgi:hypothetical protein